MFIVATNVIANWLPERQPNLFYLLIYTISVAFIKETKWLIFFDTPCIC